MNKTVQKEWVKGTPVAMPRLHGALANYLATDKEFRGIGPALASRLADRFGRNLHQALSDRDPAVADLLGHELAEATFAAFQIKAQEADLVAWLENHGITEEVGVRTAIKIARCWGEAGVEALADNPYLLLAFLPWRTVDQVARTLGIGLDDRRRWVAAVEATLYRRLDQNDTWVSEKDVEAGVAKLLNSVASPAGSPAPGLIEAAIESGGAVRLGQGVQPFGAAVMEETIAQALKERVSSDPYSDLIVSRIDDCDLEARIARFEKAQSFPLTDKQKDAIRTALTSRIMALAGYAGSGKTTSLRGICDIAEGLGRKISLMALSGRAAQRMSQATGRPARTIAGFLQSLAGADDDALPPGALVVIDEASMVDLPTLWRIIRLLGDANLVLVGDPAQLPPIGFGLTFHVLCETPNIPSVVLDQVMRQKASTGIPSVAEAVRFGEVPSLDKFRGAMPGVSFIEAMPDRAITAIADVGMRLRAEGAETGEVQIIAPVRSGTAGIDTINRHFHRVRQSALGGEFFPGRNDIAGGDPIIWTQNDWDRGLMNGSMGRLHSVIDGVAHATLDGKPFELGPQDAKFLELSYAVSVHKAQGSQWRRVIVPVFTSRLLDRTLLYTALTRASEQVILVGDPRALRESISAAPRSLQRRVGLQLRLDARLHG